MGKGGRRPWPPEWRARVLSLHYGGMTAAEIHRKFVVESRGSSVVPSATWIQDQIRDAPTRGDSKSLDIVALEKAEEAISLCQDHLATLRRGLEMR